MDDSREGDTIDKVLYRGLFALSLIAFIAGLVINLCIITINVNDWWKGRSVTPVDHIVTSLGISRICTQCALTLYLFVVKLFLSNMYLRVILVTLNAVYALFAYVNIWLTSLLSIVFSLKIANLHTRLFLYLRRLIIHRTIYFIVFSVLLSFFNSLFPMLMSITKVTSCGTYNTTMDNPFINCAVTNSVFNYTLGTLTPLLLYYISSIVLFTSLYLHTTRMKMSSNSTINLETYYSTMKSISYTFIYNTIYSIGHFVSAFYYYFYRFNLVRLNIVLEFLPVIHSFFLIYRRANLRSQMSKVLQSVIVFLSQRKYTETREDIEVVAQWSKKGRA